MQHLTVVAPADPALVARVTSLLADQGIDLRDLDYRTIGDSAVISVLADAYDVALRVLTEAGLNTVSDDCLLLELEDRPGALAEIASRAVEANVEIRAINMLSHQNGKALVALSTTDNDSARRVLDSTIIN